MTTSTLTLLSLLAVDASAQFGVLDAYVGGEAGFSRSESNVQTMVSGTGYFAGSSVVAINGIGLQNLDPKGFSGGGFAGVDFLGIGPVIVGAQASFGFLTNEESTSTTITYPCCAPTEFTLTQTAKPEWLLTVRPRIGVTVGPALVYATGGWAVVGLGFEEVFTDTFASAMQNAELDGTQDGWTYGGGAEMTLSGPWSVRGEYLRSTFGPVSVDSTNLMTGPTAYPTRIFTYSGDLDLDTVQGGISYRF